MREETNRSNILHFLNQNEREFVEYVLQNYIDIGVNELAVKKLEDIQGDERDVVIISTVYGP